MAICYRDMTFCESPDCQNRDCFRRLNQDIVDAANRWWGEPGAPIAVEDFTSHCADYEKGTECLSD